MRLPFCLLISLLAAPTSAQAQPKRTHLFPSTNDVAAIRQTFDSLVKSTNTRNLQGIMDVWSQNVIESYPGQPDLDYDTLRQNYRSFVARARIPVLAIYVEQIRATSDMAVVRDTWVYTMREKSNRRSISKMRVIEVLTKNNDGKWRITRSLAYPDSYLVLRGADYAPPPFVAEQLRSRPEPPTERDAIAIRDALSNWVKAYNAKDLRGVMLIWSENARETFPGLPDRDNRAREDGYRAGFSREGVTRTYSLNIEEVQVSGDLAFVRNTWTFTVSTQTPATRYLRKSRSIEVLTRQQDGNWKIIDSLACDDSLIQT